MNARIEIRGLRVRRAGRLVLDVDRLCVPRNETLALIGPNGSGKSTLLLTLARLMKADEGEVLFDGRPAREQSDLAYRRRVALVLQEPFLLNLSVEQNVALGLRFRGCPRAEARERAELWMEQLGILPLRQRRAAQLSGGEAQRVSLARAFALQPDLLLLDEPFRALDTPTRARLLDDLGALLAETGTTTVFVTHHLDEAARLGRQVAILLNGRVRQVGLPQQVFAAPADEEVRAFISPPRAESSQFS